MKQLRYTAFILILVTLGCSSSLISNERFSDEDMALVVNPACEKNVSWDCLDILDGSK